MRGVVSAGMVAALETLGMSTAFDLVVGSSAGAINGAALLSGVAHARRRRLLRAAGLEVVREPDARAARQARDRRQRRADDHLARTRCRPGARHLRDVLHCIAVDVDSARAVDLHGMRTAGRGLERDPGLEPDAVGGRAAGRDRRAPLSRRRHGVAHPGGRGDRRGRHARARAADAPVRDPAQERVARRGPADRTPPARPQPGAGDASTATGSSTTRCSSPTSSSARGPLRRPPYVLGLRPPAGTPCVGQLERKPELLPPAPTDGERLVEAALGGRLAGRLDL